MDGNDRVAHHSSSFGRPKNDATAGCALMRFRSILLIAIVYRCSLFAFFAVIPFANEDGQPVSPLLYQAGIDFHFYVAYREIVEMLWKELLTPLESPTHIIPGPGIPFLLNVFAYDSNNTLPLAMFYLCCSVALVWVSLLWLLRRDIDWPWLLLFALLPNPVWFTLSISSDLPFALVFALFLFTYFGDGRSGRHMTAALALAIIAALLRPNGLLLLVFFAVHQAAFIRTRAAIAYIVMAIGSLLIFLSYFQPYFWAFSMSSELMTYFGVPQKTYVAGIFEELPQHLNVLLSVLTMMGAKLLYFVGLRPSYGETPLLLVLIRAAAGIILLPGLLTLAFRREFALILLGAIMLLPYVTGVSQDRYNLALLPILFWSGVAFYSRDLPQIIRFMPNRRQLAARRTVCHGSDGTDRACRGN